MKCNNTLRTIAAMAGVSLVIAACGSDSDTTDGRGDLVPAAITHLVAIDNMFSGGFPFEVVTVGTAFANTSLTQAELDEVARRLGEFGTVEFSDDPETLIRELFDALTTDPPVAVSPDGGAVVVVDDVRIDGDTAEVELHLWCGPLCGVYLTYSAEFDGSNWTITGTVGPIAVS